MFYVLISAVALGNGLSDGVFSNYFKEVYQVTAFQRGLIEFPRELPGMLCVLVIGVLGFMGDLKVAFIAQLLAAIGITVLGLFTPTFSMMLIFLFINSMGMHLFMPLQDSIGMSMAGSSLIGRHMGRYSSIRAGFSLLSALLVFFGFRTGFFSFNTDVKLIFLISAGAFAFALFMTVVMMKKVKPPQSPKREMRFVFRKQYKYFYLLTILRGVQKQIAYVYGTWVIVDILLKRADTIALLSITIGFISIFFLNLMGRWMDQFGIKNMMFVEAVSFIGIYLVYGFFVWGISSGTLSSQGYAMWMIYLIFVLDRLSMQMGMVKSIYLRSIAVNKEDVTATLSMGVSLDHLVSIIAAIGGGFVWANWGSHWVFIMAAVFSLGNLFVAYRVDPENEKAEAERVREELGNVSV
jgi:predicted MFS family arabinose efflux permease